MSDEALYAISPVDGRYAGKCRSLRQYFSEFALIKYRVQVEVEYLIALSEIPLPQIVGFSDERKEQLRGIYRNFSADTARRVKATESVTNHDVKAVEYLLKEELRALDMVQNEEFVHFGLTSQDVNNTAFPLMLRDAWINELLPAYTNLCERLENAAQSWKSVAMLARTHGQPASPTLLGKEILVFAHRLRNQLKLIAQIPFAAKFGGATGNFNAHAVAYPGIDWVAFANRFVNDTLGLHRTQVTTQIEPYDHLAAFLDGIKRLNVILIDLNRDIWQYISMGYFRQATKAGEVGSSAMPHKVNPIDFENSEGNLGVANALLEHMAAKLPISRLQRDLTDSTVLRNLGVPLAQSLIALEATSRGLAKLSLNEAVLHNDLEENWAVVAEAVQTILRREGYPKPYEALKDLTRGQLHVTQQSLHAFIDTLRVSDSVKAELKAISPHTYTGISPAL